MRTLTDCIHAVEQIENGGSNHMPPDRDRALRSLVHEICGRPWDSPEEREHAQSLVIRLELLRLRGTKMGATNGLSLAADAAAAGRPPVTKAYSGRS